MGQDGDCPHAIVRAMIQNVNGDDMSILSRNSDGKIDTFDIKRQDVWWEPHPHCPPSIRPVVGDAGNLYLHKDAFKRCHGQGKYFWGCDPTDPTKTDPGRVLFKYPNCARSEALESLAIKPTSIVVVTEDERIELGSSEYATAQHLVWDALSNFTLNRADGTQRSVWPLQLLVTGAPLDEGDASTIDLLDRSFAAMLQDVSWNSFGETIEPVLRPRAFYLFNAEF